ncbi:guanine deaminase [Pseudomonas putida]|uniref:guanine deaminase n=1 Tax=Pseudomonas putida TaxID=303 RepID=UPI000DB1F2E7|nr:guanine deaminase [Pseudomonas putida]MBI6945168.1 guanine deaminase [Pseudomonas putida]MBI6961400.1 guanine deaminase [Pseudomonas putida]PZQ39185.1 MAG: guanine deaminase [Pseudomonas putida]
MSTIKALRADLVTFTGDPFLKATDECLQFIQDAVVVITDGLITDLGPAAEVLGRLPDGVVPEHYPDAIISAGFIDTHVHYPQTEMIGAYGEQLLEWLNTYTFVAEQRFASPEHAERIAKVFLRELLRAGTTTAVVYCTVHPQSVDAFFTESSRFNTRMVAGKVLMDRNAPEALLDTAQRGYDESKALINRWHNQGRQHYCITPRFAPTSTEAQLEVCGTLAREHPDAFIQTHLCENRDEIKWVLELFPARKSYLDVYAHAGLVRDRSVFGHGIHLTEADFCTCHQTGAALAHCPTSNLFLGSGLFRLFDAKDPKRPVRVGLGTDLGAGTSFSQLQSLNEAYKVAQMNQTRLNAVQAFYLATRGSAEALCLEDRIGTVAKGYEADLVILDKKATPLLAFRSEFCKDIIEQLFVLMILGDDRAIKATYVAGEKVYSREGVSGTFTYPA